MITVVAFILCVGYLYTLYYNTSNIELVKKDFVNVCTPTIFISAILDMLGIFLTIIHN